MEAHDRLIARASQTYAADLATLDVRQLARVMCDVSDACAAEVTRAGLDLDDVVLVRLLVCREGAGELPCEAPIERCDAGTGEGRDAGAGEPPCEGAGERQCGVTGERRCVEAKWLADRARLLEDLRRTLGTEDLGRWRIVEVCVEAVRCAPTR